MIKKPEIKLTPDQIRERTDRAGMRPYIVHIIDFDTHQHLKYLVFAEHPQIAIDLAREYGCHAPGSSGQATPVDTAFITHLIGQVGRLVCEAVDAHCIVSTAEPSCGSILLDTIVQPITASGNSEPTIAS
jgi:hypothetical protein